MRVPCADTVPKSFQARSKLPKKRRRVLPVEQPRRKRESNVAQNRRINAMKHQQHGHHPTLFKDAFGGAKIGKWMERVLADYLASLLFLCVE